MAPGPVPQDPGRDEDPRRVPPWPDWMDDPAYLADQPGPRMGIPATWPSTTTPRTPTTRRRRTWIPGS
jgi:hypothetical protein